MRIITGIVQLSFSHIWEPISFHSEAPKYRTTVIVRKDDVKTLTAIRKAIDEAIAEGREKYGEDFQLEEGIRIPLKDGDATPAPNNYHGAYWLNANSTEAPEIVNQELNPIEKHDMVKSGDFVRISLDFSPTRSVAAMALPADWGISSWCAKENALAIPKLRHKILAQTKQF